jgi:hypothetical protein
MKATKPHISFLQTFKTMPEAEAYANRMVGETFIIQLYHDSDLSLFSVCGKADMEAMHELLTQPTK